jgi:arginase
MNMSRVSVVGVPSSAGSYAAGQDQAPTALRAAGLIDALMAAGLEVNDDGDLPTQIWKPDRAHPFAQNLEQVRTCLQDLTNRLRPLLSAGDTLLVLGGNCTIALSVMAALQQFGGATPGLLYIDRHFDLNVPESTIDGALDWMGMAHALSLPGCADELADAFDRRPLLQPNEVAWLGIDAAPATEWERNHAGRLGLLLVRALHSRAIPLVAPPPRSRSFHQARSPSTSTSMCWISRTLHLRRTPTAATVDQPLSNSVKRSGSRRAIRDFARCRLAN